MSAFFAGSSSIIAKRISPDTDTDAATAVRSVVVLALMGAAVAAGGSAVPLESVPGRTLLFIAVSGLALGAAWVLFYRALDVGDANKVVPVDRTSTVMAMLMAMAFLGEPADAVSLTSMAMIAAGTLMMIAAALEDRSGGRRWLVLSVFSAFFTALSSVCGKPGADAVDPVFATALRTVMFLAVAWAAALLPRRGGAPRRVARRDWIWVIASGLVTGLAWICFYSALSGGPASIVTPIDKLSLLVTAVLSYFVLHEGMDRRAVAGLAVVTCGTLLLLLSA